MRKYIALIVALFVLFPAQSFCEEQELSLLERMKKKWLLGDWAEEAPATKETVQPIEGLEGESPIKKVKVKKVKVEKPKYLTGITEAEPPKVIIKEVPEKVTKKEKRKALCKAVKETNKKKPFDKKETFRVDLSVTSTQPVNVAMKRDRLVVKKVEGEGIRVNGEPVRSGQVVSVDMARADERSRVHCYIVPTWLFRAKPFEKNNNLEVGMRYQYASDAYVSGGSSKDITAHVFGYSSVRVRDILLASKLVATGQVNDYSSGTAVGGYLGTIANQEVCFDGSLQSLEVSFGYARHILDDIFTIGFHVPLETKRRELKLKTNSLVSDNEAFNNKYCDCFEDFFKDILCQKGMSWNRRETQTGFGTVSGFVNAQIKSDLWDRMYVGLNVDLPTAKKRDASKLWGPELGNGGFLAFSLFGSAMTSYHAFFNPHIFVQGTYNVGTRVTRRVPKVQSYTEPSGGSPNNLAGVIPMGDLIRTIPGTTNFSTLETCLKRFATCPIEVRLRKSPELNVRVGNVFEKLIWEYAFLDIFYDVRVTQGEDHISSRDLDTSYAINIIAQDTYQAEHNVGLNFIYQFEDDARFMLGGMYTFAGRNVPKTFEVNAALLFEW